MDQALKDLEGLQIDGMDQFDSQLEDAVNKLEALGDLGDKAEEAEQGAEVLYDEVKIMTVREAQAYYEFDKQL